jgi:hypothetical protein
LRRMSKSIGAPVTGPDSYPMWLKKHTSPITYVIKWDKGVRPFAR